MLAAAFLPVGKLADYSNSGTLFAFMMVAISVMVLRRTDPSRKRPFRTPAVGIIAPIAILGCIALYVMLRRSRFWCFGVGHGRAADLLRLFAQPATSAAACSTSPNWRQTRPDRSALRRCRDSGAGQS